MTTTQAIPNTHATARPGPPMRPLHTGAGPVRMTRVALPNTDVHLVRAPTTPADTYTPTTPTTTPTTTRAAPPATAASAPVAPPPPTFRPLPGRLRMRSLPDAAPPAMTPLAPSAGPVRMRPLDTAPGPADTLKGAAATSAAAGFAAPSFGAGLDAQRSFSEALGAAARSDAIAARQDRPEQAVAREAAEKLIATTLVEPILKQMRETNNAAPPFGPTPAEKQFGALLDHRLSHDLVRSANFPIVDRVARDLLRNLGDQA